MNKIDIDTITMARNDMVRKLYVNIKNKKLYLVIDVVFSSDNNKYHSENIQDNVTEYKVIYTDGKDKFCRDLFEFNDKFQYLTDAKLIINCMRLYNDYEDISSKYKEKTMPTKIINALNAIHDSIKYGINDSSNFDNLFQAELVNSIQNNYEEYVEHKRKTDKNEFVSFEELKIMEGGEQVCYLLDFAGDTIMIDDETLEQIKLKNKKN